MHIASPQRLIWASVCGVILALVLGAQALSSVSTKAAPDLAVSLFPANGEAREELAFKVFAGGVEQPEDAPEAAQAASDLARMAAKSDPLNPKAYAILAIAQSDEAQQRRIVEAATRINRRDLSVQGLALQHHLAESDYRKTIDTLDQILRVHPKYSAEFFPVLTQALSEEETIPEFARMLDGSSPWHGRFLTHAVTQQEALPNLALLRQQITVDDERFDRSLIVGLTRIGDVDLAEAVFRHVTGVTDSLSSTGVIDWAAAYPPFEWQLVDQPGFRAQPSQDGKQLEISIRPGKGGLIAGRLMRAPTAPFMIRITHRIAPSEQLRDVRIQLTCAGQTTAFYDERLNRADNGLRVDALPADCDHFILGINARAWSGRSALGGTIDTIEIAPMAN